MKEIYLPELGAVKVLKVIVFSNSKALLLGSTVDIGFGHGDEDVWQYFNPENGEVLGY